MDARALAQWPQPSILVEFLLRVVLASCSLWKLQSDPSQVKGSSALGDMDVAARLDTTELTASDGSAGSSPYWQLR